jgi:hypothetical protein
MTVLSDTQAPEVDVWASEVLCSREFDAILPECSY